MNGHVILTDFLLSREAKLCSEDTLDFYQRMLTPFIESLQTDDITSQDVRRFLASVAKRGVSSATVHAHARAIRAFVRFAHAEGYLANIFKVDMPKVHVRRMEVLTPAEIKKVLTVCNFRDKAIVLVLIDSGLRRAELWDLTWDDVDIKTGSILVRNGKGGKARTAVIGVKARRALLKWRMKAPDDNGRIFNLTGSGLASAMERISKSSGVKIGCHKCRRSFATMALRSGINLIALQRLLGHSTLDMVRVYIAQVDEDLLQAYRDHSPMDRFLN